MGAGVAFHEPFGVLTQQSTGTADALATRCGDFCKCIFSAEHGYWGIAGAGEKTHSSIHPRLGIPVHSLYGEYRKPPQEMLAGLRRIVVDLQDIGVRCYTYFATLKNMLEAAAEIGVAVTVLDRPVPLGGAAEGPMIEGRWMSFVGPANVPLRHAMTPGECATWIVREQNLDVELDVVKLAGWSHETRGPWSDFVPPSPAIRSWDSAVMYPATVWTEAFSAFDCDRSGNLAFRVIGGPGMDACAVAEAVGDELANCGFAARPYRWAENKEGLLLSLAGNGAYRPCEAGIRLAAAMVARTPALADGARPEWMAKLYGSAAVYDAVLNGDVDELVASWRQPPFEPVNLY
ncbi:MAG: DUF1343 domain-containing protein [Kiritimatiellae bacterium]|nr:DUF1343 domain-containing protein [Kiritimatiellia bacterium]